MPKVSDADWRDEWHDSKGDAEEVAEKLYNEEIMRDIADLRRDIEMQELRSACAFCGATRACPCQGLYGDL